MCFPSKQARNRGISDTLYTVIKIPIPLYFQHSKIKIRELCQAKKLFFSFKSQMILKALQNNEKL